MSRRRLLTLGTIAIACAAVFVVGLPAPGEQAGPVLDEARQAGLPAKHFLDHVADEDYFHDMDGGDRAHPRRDQGPQHLARVDRRQRSPLGRAVHRELRHPRLPQDGRRSHPGLKFSRDNRWNYLGLVNEPCFEKATGPDPDRFGLWLDKRRADCPPDPFENETKYPGVPIGARGKNRAAPAPIYGYATGIVGLRLFPNPAFDEAAAQEVGRRALLHRPDLLPVEGPRAALPRRHVVRASATSGRTRSSRRPTRRTRSWENLSSNVGAQYFWVDRIFDWEREPDQLHLPALPHLAARARSTRRSSPPTTSTTRAR